MPLIFEDANNAPAAQDTAVKTGTLQSFKTDVVEESKNRIVLAYFTSPKNPACDQFAALLEKYVRLANGKASLVKFDLLDVQPLAMQLGIQSVPTTMIFAKGGLVDGFAGAIPESQLKTVMQALIGKAALSLDDMLKDATEKLNNKQGQEALEAFAAVLEKDEANPSAFAGMIRAFILLGQLDAAQDLADGLDASVKNPELEAAKTALKLALEAKGAPAPDDLAQKVEQNPQDLKTRFDYACALFAAGQPEQAIDQLIFIIEKERDWNNDAAKQQLFKIFAALGQTNPVTAAGRRKLSSLLFS
ncbi:MAG: tetratricopeptide repeat protein [Alphaproteobacteria bacterium]|nr:tetratricopeptide repeat protein [Alphaproteobacteria bacterium]